MLRLNCLLPLLLYLCIIFQQHTEAALYNRSFLAGSGSGAGPLDDEEDSGLNGAVSGHQTPDGRQSGSSAPSNVKQLDLPALSAGKQSGAAGNANEMSAVPCSAYLATQLSHLPYRPVCSLSNSSLYAGWQCESPPRSFCYCVDALTGRPIPGTHSPPGQLASSCRQLKLRFTIGLHYKWKHNLHNPRSKVFQNCAKSIETELNKLFKSFQGSQLVRVENFRKMSVVLVTANITSVGHPASEDTVAAIRKLLESEFDDGSFANIPVLSGSFWFGPVPEPQQQSIDQTTELDSKGNSAKLGDKKENKPVKGHNVANMAGRTTEAAAPAESPLLQPATLAGLVGGGVAALLLIVGLIAFCIYRVRKADEGSYSLDPVKKTPATTEYQKAPTREFYA